MLYEVITAAIENVFVSPSRSLQPGERFTLEYLLYFGPKDLDILVITSYSIHYTKLYDV